MVELAGRCAIVSGAARGIGAAIAARLRVEGARVVSIDVASGAEVDHEIVCDLRDGAALAERLAAARADFGPADILIHAAAAMHYGGTLDTDPATFLDLYDVNVAGAVRLLQAVLPDMRIRRRGAVLMLSSINADFATPSLAAYATTKAALDSLVRTAALELAPDCIRVNAIAPASVDTAAMQASFDRQPDPVEARQRNVARHPLGRLGTPADVAELALFLVSDRAAWITGAIYPIDGGAGVTRR